MPNASSASAPHSPPAVQSTPVQFYEDMYTSNGPQEWIFLPDIWGAYVCLWFPQPGAAFIEASASPPDILSKTANFDVTGGASPCLIPLTETVSDTTAIYVRGPTAIRVNNLGGSKVAISVRC